jgi:hypothetical protein
MLVEEPNLQPNISSLILRGAEFMANNEKGKLSIAWIIAMIVASVVTTFVKYPTTTFNIIGYLGLESGLTTSLFAAFIGILSGVIVYFVFSRLIKIDEL